MITYSDRQTLDLDQIILLYQANGWSSAQKPKQLQQALLNSHSLISAWDDDRLVGLGNAISDGFLVVYYPHLLVHPDYQRQGIGRKILEILKKRYSDLHMHILVAENEAVDFYKKCGFIRAGSTEPMWIYDGDDQ